MTEMQNGSLVTFTAPPDNNSIDSANNTTTPVKSVETACLPSYETLRPSRSPEPVEDHNGEGPPSKRRKIASTAASQTPPAKIKPQSPPWRKHVPDGPSTFEQDGKRKSARTNRLPLELQAQSNKRQTRAAAQKPSQLSKSKFGHALKSDFKSLIEAPSNRQNSAKYSASSGKLTPNINGRTLRKQHIAGTGAEHSGMPNLPNKRPYKKRTQALPTKKYPGAIQGKYPHRSRGTAQSSEENMEDSKQRQPTTNGWHHSDEETDNDEEDEDSEEEQEIIRGPNYKPQRLNLRVRLPSVTIHHPEQILPPRRYPSFRDWFNAEGSKDPDNAGRKTQDKVQEEADLRKAILDEAKEGGLLSKEKSLIYAPEAQLEPARQYAHHDYFMSHALYFRKLLNAENERHRKAARELAREAAERWKALQPKTEAEILQELEGRYRAVYKQVRKDLQHKWDLVTLEVERRRLQKWEEEQQLLGKEALNKVLEQSTQLLVKRRRRSSSSEVTTEESEVNQSGDDGEAGSSSHTPDEDNMSSSESHSEDSAADDDDEGLTQEQLVQKYARMQGINDTTSLQLGEVQGLVHDPGGIAIERDIDNGQNRPTASSQTPEDEPPAGIVEVEEVEDVMMDNSDESTDMDDDTSDSDEERSSDDGESEESEDLTGKTGLLGFFHPKELQAIENGEEASRTEKVQSEEEAEDISIVPDAAQVQTPSASNSEEPHAEIPKTDLPANIGQGPLKEMMDVHGVMLEQRDSLPTTPVSTNALKTPVPSLLRGTLREYQHFGLDWLAGLYANGTNGILADEMGLGKTIQTIALLAHLAVEHEVWGPHLIVVPTSVMLNWEMEFKKFLPGFKVLTYYGTQEERKQKRQGWITDSDRWNVWITSYQLALKDDQVFKRREWHYMVLDEAHNIKNFRSKRWQTLLTFNTRARLLLTGTPLQNNLTELWSLLFFLMPSDSVETGIGGFADLKEFTEWFQKPVEQILENGRDYMDDDSKAIVAKLHQVLRPYLLRRLKADVEKQMPGKFEHVVYCRLSKRQRYLYDGFMSRAQTRETLASGNYLSIINCLMQLRKVCNHPDLFETRQIVTSFAMPKSVVADFEIKELLVRRRLLSENPIGRVDLNLVNLLPGSNEQPSALDTIQKQRLGALGALRQLTSQQWGRIDQAMQFDGSSTERALAYMENSARRSRFEELRHAAYLTSLRSQRRPLYSNSLIERLSVNTKAFPSSPMPEKRIGISRWLDELSPTLVGIVPTLPQRSEAMETTIKKFACVTPAVTACDMAPLTLAPRGVEVVRSAQQLCPIDAFHEARMRLSIAFPDKRLLQYDCGKLQRLDGLLRTLQSGGHRALIFTQMTKVLDILEQFLNIHGHRYLRLDGSTKIEQRQILTERFNNDPRILVFILSSRSGGLGINLTGADSVIFYDLDWNPAMDKQCQDRCHRIGQTRDVHIYRFVSEYTIEANILRKANQKRMLDDVVIQEGEFTTEYFNRPGSKDVLGEQGLSGDAEADAAMDRVFGGRANNKVFEQVEDQEDIAAARIAEKESIQTDAADFDDKAVGSSGATPKTPGPPTPGEIMPPPPAPISKDVEHVTTLEAADSGLVAPSVSMAQDAEEEEDEEEDGGHIDEYMLRLVEWELHDVPLQVPTDKSKKKLKKPGGEHRVRAR